MNKEKLNFWVTVLVGIIAGGFIFIVLMKYIIPVLAPFLIAWAMAFAVRRPAKSLSGKIRVPERIIRLFMAIFATLAVFGILALLVWQLTAAVWRFLSDIGEGNIIYDILTELTNPKLPIFGDSMPRELAERISEALSTMLSGALSMLAEVVTSWVGFIPKALFFLLVTVISLIYFALDLERINARVKALLPERVAEMLSKVRIGIFSVGGKYLRSYLLIMLITFVIMLSGFLIIGVEHAVLLALVVSVLDLLPVIGVGTVLVPWSVFELAAGNHAIGIGLLVLFVVNVVIRQLAEPKIVGKSLDMHPILTLVFLYVGYALFGIQGLIIIPVVAVVVGLLFKENRAPEIDEGGGGE